MTLRVAASRPCRGSRSRSTSGDGSLSRGAASVGNLFRKVQSGELQAYAFAFGLGVILVIYFTVFY